MEEIRIINKDTGEIEVFQTAIINVMNTVHSEVLNGAISNAKRIGAVAIEVEVTSYLFENMKADYASSMQYLVNSSEQTAQDNAEAEEDYLSNQADGQEVMSFEEDDYEEIESMQRDDVFGDTDGDDYDNDGDIVSEDNHVN